MQSATKPHVVLTKTAAMASAILLAGAMVVAVSGQTMANPAIAQKTGQPCGKCHTAPPALNDYGKKYKAGN
jgi:hypothetical protein